MSDQSTTTLPTQYDANKFAINLDGLNELRDILDGAPLDNLDQLESSPINIATQYFDFQLNKAERFVFLGITQRPAQDTAEMKPAIAIMDKGRNTYINMGTILVSTFIDHDLKIGTPVEITWIGTKKTQDGGQVRLWNVRPLMA